MGKKLYYVQDKRQIVGNSMLWWAKDSRGYTCDIRKAHVFSESEIKNFRDTDIPWPKDFIDGRLQHHVDCQSVKTDLEQWKVHNETL